MRSRAERGGPGFARAGTTWLHGPVPDLLLGAGALYLLSVPAFWLAARGAVASDWPLSLVWVLAILVNSPHYGATLLRVYEQREERRRYAFFAVWATGLLLAIFAVGLHQPVVGSLLLTLYFTWSPWHFAGQNYGVALMFLRRSGIPVSLRTQRLLYASFALSFALTFLALHVEGSSSYQAPTRGGPAEEIALLRLGIPGPLAGMGMLACGVAYLASLLGVAVSLCRVATARQLLPVACLVLLQALWFTVPSLLDLTGAWSARSLAFAAIWISATHSLQYLWVTSYYARRSTPGTGLGRYLLKATLAGNAVFVIPAVVFAPGWLGGRLTFDGGLSALVFALVNLHHFVLDGAVWKLRDGRVARVLLRETPEPSTAQTAAPRRRGLRTAFWAACGLCVALEVAELVRQRAQLRGADQLASAILDGLALAGRDHELARIRLGRSRLEQGDYAAARAEFEKSARARPTRAAWGGLGRALEGQGDLRGAAEAYETGLGVDPDDAALLRSAGLVRLRLGEPERAAALLARVLQIEPGDARTRRVLDAIAQPGPRN